MLFVCLDSNHFYHGNLFFKSEYLILGIREIMDLKSQNLEKNISILVKQFVWCSCRTMQKEGNDNWHNLLKKKEDNWHNNQTEYW